MDELIDYVEHAFIHMSTRRVILRDVEGYTEEVRFNFDEEGMDSFEDTISLLQDFLDPSDLTFVF